MANGFAAYYGQNYVFRDLQSIIELILLDHSYAKPWSSHPDASKARPMKTFFLPKDDEQADKKVNGNEVLDVCEDETSSVASSITYDVAKARVVMAECEKHVNFVCSKRTPDTWEEQICRSGWSSKQNSLFDKVIKVLSSLRLARLTYDSLPNEPVLRRIATDKATKRLRQILCLVEWEAKLTSWLHATLIDGLSIPLLACYLDVLQTLKAKAPTLVEQMITPQSSHRRGQAANSEALNLLLKRPWDPAHSLGTQHKQRKLPGSPLLLIVPSGPTTNSGTGSSSKRSRFWHNQLSVLGKVVPVTMHTSNGGSGVTISQCLDHIIGAVRTKVLELRSHYPNRPVILIGWGVGALVSCQVALMESVCAVVCLGFPFTGLDGVRGDVEDPLLEGKTPTLFVIGSHSSLSSQEDLEELRERLKADTSLLVVGGADDQLRLSRAKKKQEGMTQSMVDRLIMDEIGDFLGNVLTSVNNLQPRVDVSDVDEIEVRKKKRKRSALRDIPAELRTSSEGQSLQPLAKMARGNSNMGGEAGGTKVLMKIPVGHTLGSVTSAIHLNKDHPSPAKKPRISKSKSKAPKPSPSSGHAPITLHSSGGTTLPSSQIIGQSRVTNLQSLTLGGIGRPVPLSNVSATLASAKRDQSFVSLATPKSVSGMGTGQSLLAIQRTGSPSVIPSTTPGTSLQYVIKPQSHPGMAANVIPAVPSGSGSGNPLSVSSNTLGSLHHTTLTQSATSPFTTVLPMKGKLASQSASQILLKGSGTLPTSLTSSTALAKLSTESSSKIAYSRVGQSGRGYIAQLTSTSQSSTPLFVHVKEGARKLVTQASSVTKLKPTTTTTTKLVNIPQPKPQGTVQKSTFSIATQVHTTSAPSLAVSASQMKDTGRKLVSSAPSKPRFVTQAVSSPHLSQPLTTAALKHSTYSSSRIVSSQVSSSVSQPTAKILTAVDTAGVTRMVTSIKGLTRSPQSSSVIVQGNKKLTNLLRVVQTTAVSGASGTVSPIPTSLGSFSVARLSTQTTTPTRTPVTHTVVAAPGVLSSPSNIQILTQHPVSGGKTQGGQVITISRTMATSVSSGTTTYTIPASLFKQVVSSSMTRPISTLSVKQGAQLPSSKLPAAVVQSRSSSGEQLPIAVSAVKVQAGSVTTAINTLNKQLVQSAKQVTTTGTKQAVVAPSSKSVLITQVNPSTAAADNSVSKAEPETAMLQSSSSTSHCQTKTVGSAGKPVVTTTVTESSS